MSAPKSQSGLTHAHALPVSREIHTYTQFGATFEPWEYTDWIDESMSWKDTLYIGDWSPLGKMRVKGRDALKFFSSISVNSFARFDVGQAKHVIFCNRAGKIMGEGVLMKLAEEDYLFTSGPGVAWADYQFRKGRYDAEAAQIGDRQFILQLQGPNSLFVMERATGESLRDIGFMRFRPTQIGNKAFTALRQGMAGEVGYELHGPIEHAREIFNALMEVGRDFGIRRLGGRTKMVNHVEACFPTPSVDYVPAIFGEDEHEFATRYFSPNARANYRKTDGSFEYSDIGALYRTPVELGWRKNVKFDHDFIGHAALEPEVADPTRLMVTLVWNADDCADVYASLFRGDTPYQYMEMPRNILGCVFADAVLSDGRVAGISTSRCYSYYFRQMLSLCVLDAPLCAPGTAVSLMWGRPGTPQKQIRATVAPAPYKKDNRRLDVGQLAAKPAASANVGD
jgi:glycine cleavage system aminomethyltransferase T